MENFISKELLSEVLNQEIVEYSVHTGVVWLRYKDFSSNINTYELAHKIEDWIESKDIRIIRIKENKLYEFYIDSYIDEESNELFFENSITSENKINGIIAVGEFILKAERK